MKVPSAPMVTPWWAAEREPRAWKVVPVAVTVEPWVYRRYGRCSDSGAGPDPLLDTTVTFAKVTVAELPARYATPSARRSVLTEGPMRNSVCGRWRRPARRVAVPPERLAQRSSPIARTTVSRLTAPAGSGTTRTRVRLLMRSARCGRSAMTGPDPMPAGTLGLCGHPGLAPAPAGQSSTSAAVASAVNRALTPTPVRARGWRGRGWGGRPRPLRPRPGRGGPRAWGTLRSAGGS